MWRYKINYELLYSGDILCSDICKVVAKNRGLPADWCKRKFDRNSISNVLNFKNIRDAVYMFFAHVRRYSKIQIVVDCDVDGYCSAAIVGKLIKSIIANVNDDKSPTVEYLFHKGKQHGLSNDIKIDNNTNLVILPDSGSNDIERCKELHERGIDVLVLDHHVIEEENPYAVVINCMDDQYPIEISGTSVVWQFANILASEFNSLYRGQIDPDEWLDYVAIATIADSIDVTNEENMFYVQSGLCSIKSDFFAELLTANEVMIDEVTVEDVKFKISPYVNAIIRMGSMEEKELLFKAFLGEFEVFDYSKRGSFEVTKENIYERAVRLCKNAKSRQDREKKKCLESFSKNPSLLTETPYIIIADCSNANPNITGLVANELASSKLKPCLCIRSYDSSNGIDEFANFKYGSMRNYSGSPIEDLKTTLESTELFDFVRGHNNSAGFKIVDENVHEISAAFESQLNNEVKAQMGFKKTIVDFELPIEKIDLALCKRLSIFDNFTGNGFPEVTALVTNIHVTEGNFTVMGKNSLNWKIKSDEDVSIVKFKLSKDDELLCAMDGFDGVWSKEYYINAICSLSLNNYNGTVSTQCIVKDYQITSCSEESSDIDFEDDIDFDF